MTGPVLLLEAHSYEAIAGFSKADFSYTTSTGYGVIYLALPAIVEKGTVIVVDEKSHSSIYTGMHGSEMACV